VLTPLNSGFADRRVPVSPRCHFGTPDRTRTCIISAFEAQRSSFELRGRVGADQQNRTVILCLRSTRSATELDRRGADDRMIPSALTYSPVTLVGAPECRRQGMTVRAEHSEVCLDVVGRVPVQVVNLERYLAALRIDLAPAARLARVPGLFEDVSPNWVAELLVAVTPLCAVTPFDQGRLFLASAKALLRTESTLGTEGGVALLALFQVIHMTLPGRIIRDAGAPAPAERVVPFFVRQCFPTCSAAPRIVVPTGDTRRPALDEPRAGVEPASSAYRADALPLCYRGMAPDERFERP
jgi:hypothetical protein